MTCKHCKTAIRLVGTADLRRALLWPVKPTHIHTGEETESGFQFFHCFDGDATHIATPAGVTEDASEGRTILPPALLGGTQ